MLDGRPLGPPKNPLGQSLTGVELALAHALVHASEAGEWSVVAVILGELAARREGR
jgi:hypothetical protein